MAILIAFFMIPTMICMCTCMSAATNMKELTHWRSVFDTVKISLFWKFISLKVQKCHENSSLYDRSKIIVKNATIAHCPEKHKSFFPRLFGVITLCFRKNGLCKYLNMSTGLKNDIFGMDAFQKRFLKRKRAPWLQRLYFCEVLATKTTKILRNVQRYMSWRANIVRGGP